MDLGDKILVFKRKLSLWKNHIVKGNFTLFSLLLGIRRNQRVSSLTKNDLEVLEKTLNSFFSFFQSKWMTG